MFILLLLLTACADKSSKQTSSAADTTQVIELALKTVLGQPFPDMDGVKRKSIFHDSIFLTTNLLPLSSLPSSVDSFRFKIVPDTMICSAIKADTITTELPNYLKLQTFEKTDTGYFVRFESIDCIPSASLAGSVSLHILKTKDKYVFNHK
ncbi:MAG: hypothetical protein ABI675_01705 [Chitinophagaceae bacterium]